MNVVLGKGWCSEMRIRIIESCCNRIRDPIKYRIKYTSDYGNVKLCHHVISEQMNKYLLIKESNTANVQRRVVECSMQQASS